MSACVFTSDIFQWNCDSGALGRFCLTYRWLNVQFRFLGAQTLNWLFPTIWITVLVVMWTAYYMYICVFTSHLSAFLCPSCSIIIHIYCVSFNFAAGQEVVDSAVQICLSYTYVCIWSLDE